MQTVPPQVTRLFAQGEDEKPLQGSLTDFKAPIDYASLEKQIVYAAHVEEDASFGVGINPLIAAAADIFSEIIKVSNDSQHVPEFRTRMTDKLKLFEGRAVRAGIVNTDVMAARYVLCTVIDEAVTNSEWGSKTDEWSKASLSSQFHNDTQGGEKFFELLDRLSANPSQYLYMLELMYVCLALGFKGRYALRDHGFDEVDATRHKLFTLIRALRGDHPGDLSPHWQGIRDTQPKGVLIVPGWMVGLFTLSFLVLGYLGFSSTLNVQRHAVLEPFETFESTSREPQS